MFFIQRRVYQVRAIALTTTLSCLGAAFLFVVRWALAGRPNYAYYLPFNFFLAMIPLGIALLMQWMHTHPRAHTAPLACMGLLWLLFLPNAPYICTDIIHAFYPHVPGNYGAVHWCDIMVILSVAWNGMLIGFISMMLCHGIIRDRLGSRTAWMVSTFVTVVQCFGVTLGRVYRLNSWDVLIHPLELAGFVARVGLLSDAHLYAISGTIFIFLGSAYLTLASLTQPRTIEHRA